jgi:hypothetical protein
LDRGFQILSRANQKQPLFKVFGQAGFFIETTIIKVFNVIYYVSNYSFYKRNNINHLPLSWPIANWFLIMPAIL